jgi:Type IX secretion system protein PorV
LGITLPKQFKLKRMKKATLKLAAFGTLLCACSTYTNAQSTSTNVPTSAVPFLRIAPDARGAGMGDVGIATSPDANAVFWNTAKNAFNASKAGISVSYVPSFRDLGFDDIYLASLAGYIKISDKEAIAGSFRYFSLGSIQFADNLGNELNSFRPREMAIDFSYSRKLSEKNSIGIGLRVINSNLAGGESFGGIMYKAGTAVAADLHYFHKGEKENGEGFNYGFTLSNLGSKISYTSDASQKDFIPADLGIGAAYSKVFDEDNKIVFGLDIHKLLVPTPPSASDSVGLVKYNKKGVVGSWFSSLGDAPDGFSEEIKELQVSAGVEYWYKEQFAVRAGYFYENPAKGNRKYFTMGAGIKYNMFGVNFSYLLPSGTGIGRNPMSNTLRFSLILDLKHTDPK